MKVLLTILTTGLLASSSWAGGYESLLDAESWKNFGVAHLEQEEPKDAIEAFREVVRLAPDELLGYANLGLSHLRINQLDSARAYFERALEMEPENADVHLLIAEWHQFKADVPGAIESAGRTLELRPKDPLARYLLYKVAASRPTDRESAALAARTLSGLYQDLPENLVIAVLYATQLAIDSDLEALAPRLEALKLMAGDVNQAPRIVAAAETALQSGNAKKTKQYLLMLGNVLRPSARYKQALTEIQSPVAGLPILRFSQGFYDRIHEADALVDVRLTSASGLPAAGRGLRALEAADVNGDGRDDLLLMGTGGLVLWTQADAGWKSSHTDGAKAVSGRLIDVDNNGVLDIAVSGPDGLRLIAGDTTGSWRDITDASGISDESIFAIVAVDADNEGDLDLVAGTEGGAQFWQNASDGTFANVSSRTGLPGLGSRVVELHAADLDDDLDTDLVAVDAEGRLHVLDNKRLGLFGLLGIESQDVYKTVAVADFNGDGRVDLAGITKEGHLVIRNRIQDGFGDATSPADLSLVANGLVVLDADNDGRLDILLFGEAGSVLLRNRGDGSWGRIPMDPAVGIRDAASTDLDGDGDLDVVAIGLDGGLTGWENDGGNANHWLRVRLQGLRISGTKNNLNGIGSKLEVKAGLHYQMQYVNGPVTHFGLGKHSTADVVRVTWSNGVPQNRFRAGADQTFLEPQILKGSCPYLYAWDGERFAFVTDLLGAAPLGLQLADGVIAPDKPRELMTVPRDRVALRDGGYEFRFTEELWEAIYLDETALWVVDHPSDVEVFTDQRFTPPPYSEPKPIFTSGRISPVSAQNTSGEEVVDRLVAFDHRYPEALTPTQYQGLTDLHTLTVTFGDVEKLQNPALMLGAWIFWTDTSINVAISQGKGVRPQPPQLEVWSTEDGWRPVDRPLGLPTGKDKWMVVSIPELDRADARVRIRTNYQIYWDQAFLTDVLDEAPNRTTVLPPTRADLRYGGYSEMYRPAPDGPHLYDYEKKVDLPLWMDVEGLATRYGDVKELLTARDDRHVVFVGGDEIAIRFDATPLPELPPGWVRDLLFLSDGWDKDFDRNTVTGTTVGPLPFHAMSRYPYPDNERYPDTQLHRSYVETYNTRPVGPGPFRRYVKRWTPGQEVALPWEKVMEAGERVAK